LFLSALGELPFLPGLPGRFGFLTAGAATAIALALAALRRTRACLSREVWVLGAACAAVVVSRFVSVIGAADQPAALWQAVRVMTVLVFFLLVRAEAARFSGAGNIVATAAAALIVVHTAILACGAAWFAASGELGSFRGLFDTERHEALGLLPRFAGLPGEPFATGWLMLSCAMCVAWIERRSASLWLTVAALAVCLATLSFASLLVPVVLVLRFVPNRWGKLSAVALTLLAVTVLYVHPVAFQRGGQRIDLLPAYQGPPEVSDVVALHETQLPFWTLVWQRTVYLQLLPASLDCFAGSPIAGVGGRNHAVSCRAPTVNTLGEWAPGRVAHSEYTGLLAEHGLLGLAAAALLAFLLARLWSPRQSASAGPLAGVWSPRQSAWTGPLLVAYLLAGLAGEVWFQFPMAAAIGLATSAAGGLKARRNSAWGGTPGPADVPP